MPFIKGLIQPPSGGVNRESCEGRGVCECVCVCRGGGGLPWHVPKPFQAGPGLSSEAGGPLDTPVSLSPRPHHQERRVAELLGWGWGGSLKHSVGSFQLF